MRPATTWPGSRGWCSDDERGRLDRSRWGGRRSTRARALRRGSGVAIFPADTLYGLACDPLQRGCRKRIHEIKGRDEGKSSAVMYFSPLAMRELVSAWAPEPGTRSGRFCRAPRSSSRIRSAVIPSPVARTPSASASRLIEAPLAGACDRSSRPAPTPAASPRPAARSTRGILGAADLAIDAAGCSAHPRRWSTSPRSTRRAAGRSCGRGSFQPEVERALGRARRRPGSAARSARVTPPRSGLRVARCAQPRWRLLPRLDDPAHLAAHLGTAAPTDRRHPAQHDEPAHLPKLIEVNPDVREHLVRVLEPRLIPLCPW